MMMIALFKTYIKYESRCNSIVPRFTNARDRLNIRMAAYDVHSRVTEDLQLDSMSVELSGEPELKCVENKLQIRFRLVFVILGIDCPCF